MVSAGFNLSPSGSVSLDKKLVYGKESILVSFKVSYIYIYIYIYMHIYIQSWFGSRQKDICLPNLSEYFFIKHKIIKQYFKTLT